MQPPSFVDLRSESRSALAALQAVLPLIHARRGVDDVREKAPNDIVTGTDVLVQSTLQQVLHERHPEVGFVGEESGLDAPSSAPRHWLVDPICGTANYAAGIPLFATNVALVEDGRLSLSAVLDGGSRNMYVAESGRGAWHVDPEQSGLTRLSVDPANRLVSIDPDPQAGHGARSFSTAFAVEALRRRSWDVRALSTTLALVYVATGQLGAAVYRTLGTALHVAAGVLLARQAGGFVTDQDGMDWTLDSPVCVAASSQALHAELLAVVEGVYAATTATGTAGT
ncbi:MAG: inositol monophosphatase [Chloroflexi bacterium]|nr:inositol monophosphatase [Chloroflexota bacterium]MBV9601447.1 inositol monophosphatase [Chloroflexota bacterium]